MLAGIQVLEALARVLHLDQAATDYAANSLVRALSPYPDWQDATARLVAGFRESAGSDTDDPGFVQLVGELSLSSERFRRLWARHDMQSREGMPTRIHRPHGSLGGG